MTLKNREKMLPHVQDTLFLMFYKNVCFFFRFIF